MGELFKLMTQPYQSIRSFARDCFEVSFDNAFEVPYLSTSTYPQGLVVVSGDGLLSYCCQVVFEWRVFGLV